MTAVVGVQLPGNIRVKSFFCNNVSETECYTTSKTALVTQSWTLTRQIYSHTDAQAYESVTNIRARMRMIGKCDLSFSVWSLCEDQGWISNGMFVTLKGTAGAGCFLWVGCKWTALVTGWPFQSGHFASYYNVILGGRCTLFLSKFLKNLLGISNELMSCVHGFLRNVI